jgi:hypothetical protein
VLYDDGDEEWLDLIQERHKLLRGGSGGPGAKAAAARKRRKAVLASDDEDDEVVADDDDGKEASDSDSDFSGGCVGLVQAWCVANYVVSGNLPMSLPGSRDMKVGRQAAAAASERVSYR